MPATLPDVSINQGFDTSLPDKSATEPTPKTTDTLSALQPLIKKYIDQSGLVGEMEKKGLEEKKRLLPPAIEKVKQAAAIPTPPIPRMAPEPERPDITAKPFLSTEGKNALQTVVAGLGTLVTMVAGMKAPVAALGAITGAMTGWAEGDAERAGRDWKTYEAQVARMNRENEKAMKLWEAARIQRADDQQAAQMLFQATSAEAGLGDYSTMVAEHGMERTGQVLSTMSSMMNHSILQQNKVLETQIRMLGLQERQFQDAALRSRWNQLEKHRDDVLKNLKHYQGEILNMKKTGATAQLAKQELTVTKGINELAQRNRGLDESLVMVGQLEDAVALLDEKGVIPKGATHVDEAKAKIALQTSIGDTDVADAIQTVKRFGTSSVIRKELELMGGKGAAIMRLKAIGEAEAGDILMPPKQWWDRFVEGTRRVLRQSKELNTPMLKSYQDTLKMMKGGAAPELEVPEPPPADLGIEWEN